LGHGGGGGGGFGWAPWTPSGAILSDHIALLQCVHTPLAAAAAHNQCQQLLLLQPQEAQDLWLSVPFTLNPIHYLLLLLLNNNNLAGVAVVVWCVANTLR